MPLFMGPIYADGKSSRCTELNRKMGSSSYNVLDKTKIGLIMLEGLNRQSSELKRLLKRTQD